MIQIEGLNFSPSPNFTVQLELYKSGEEVLGGVYIYTISGTYYAEKSSDYESAKQDVLGKIGTCVSLTSADTSCSYDQKLIEPGTIGLVTDASVTPGDVLTFNYELTVEVSKDESKEFLIKPSGGLGYIQLPADLMFNNYNESVSTNYDNSKTFAADTTKFINPIGSIKININLSVKNTDICNSNSVNFPDEIRNFLNIRPNTIKSELFNGNNNYGIKIPAGATLVTVNSSISISEFSGSASFTLYIIPAGFNSKAIVSLSISESTDQITKGRKATVRGTIQGISTGSSFLQSGAGQLTNANSVLSTLQRLSPTTLQLILSGDCGDATPLDVDSCYVLSKSSTSESTRNSAVDFELVYEDVEKCVLKGYRINTSYEESPPIKKYVEHTIPNRSKPLVYYSTAETAGRKKLTVKCSYNSCDDTFMDTVKGAVDAQLVLDRGNFGLDSGNYILIKETSSEGRYSYGKTEEYIECDTSTG